MNDRIPLPVVLSAPGQRHAVPHRTFTAPKDGDFFLYLDSDDVRLPHHPYLNGRAADPAEYDTYVGEDVWAAPSGPAAASESSDEDRVKHSELVFDDVVEWVVQVLDEEAWAKDGVVVCGRFAVADDCSWAVPSRSPTVYTPREVFMVMRCSCKFMTDVHAQRTDSRLPMAEFTLAKALAGSAAKELRAFIPYRLSLRPRSREVDSCSRQKEGEASDGEGPQFTLSEPLMAYAGVCQRFSDVCFPSLMAWTEENHHNYFSIIMERVKKSALLERTCSEDPAFITRLLHRWQLARKTAGRHATAPPARADRVILLLAVDLLFESASLPVQLLSAKVRLFEAEQPGDPVACDGLAEAPYIVEPATPDEADDRAPPGAAPATDSQQTGVVSGADEEDEQEEAEDECAGECGTTDFFRLYRNELNWNKYVERVEELWAEAAQASDGQAAAADLCIKHYCVVASEAADLVTCADTLTKRGLPLELLQPELFQGNEEGMAFLRMLSAKMLQENQSPPAHSDANAQ